MIRFSCFQSHITGHKTKRSGQLSAGATDVTSQDQVLSVSSIPTNLNHLLLESYTDNPSNTSAKLLQSSTSFECHSKSNKMNSGSSNEGEIKAHQMECIKKSRSLENGLDREEKNSSRMGAKDDLYQVSTDDDSHEMNSSATLDMIDHDMHIKEPSDKEYQEISLLNQCHEALISETFQGNCVQTHSGSIFSVGDSKLHQKVHEDSVSQLSGEHGGNSGLSTPTTTPIIARSHSLPDLEICTPQSREGSSSPVYVGADYRYSDILYAQNANREESHDCGSYALEKPKTENSISEDEKDKCSNVISENEKSENNFGDGYNSFGIIAPEKDWTTEGTAADLVENLQGEFSAQKWNELPSKDYKIKRIEEWVSMINLQDAIPLEEESEPANSISETKKAPTAHDHKSTPGMDSAKSYIASLTATSTSAQLANLGLVVIPFLSAFVSLRVLNLSGNGIVKITSGALPRGLHVLNLSKNNISIIEGLRELTRLRILDLSYNRIFKIGHGLAYCTSIKELNLAGNKISEVEGLHRLLKLNILDLRFNKISTAKSLGQLAANYSSLQAISLEGNPAQRNVGDEQLKKYVQGLLPNLLYLNRQPIKAHSSKEAADRAARSALSAHKFDGSLRSEHKLVRRGSHNVSSQKLASSSSHAHASRGAGSLNRSKGRQEQMPLPPSRTTGIINLHHHSHALGMNLKRLQSGLSMHRSQSASNLRDP